ncbi:MAG: hypothetical protein IIB09_07950 [Bacteroidetes bacterium]|nr:hypothetical protein [Bacteroidota bacterium]
MYSRIADHAVVAAIGDEICLEGVFAGVAIRDVEGQQHRFAAVPANQFCSFFGLVMSLAVVQYEGVIGGRQAQRDGATDATACSGHEYPSTHILSLKSLFIIPRVIGKICRSQILLSIRSAQSPRKNGGKVTPGPELSTRPSSRGRPELWA